MKKNLKIFIDSFKEINTNYLKVAAIDTIFIIILSVIIISYNKVITNIAGKFLSIPDIQNALLENETLLTEYISTLKIVLAFSIVSGLILFITWNITQGLIWSLILKKKMSFVDFIKLTVTNLIFMVISLIVALIPIAFIYLSIGANKILIIFFVVAFYMMIFIMFHLLLVLQYSFQIDKKIFSSSKRMTKVGLKFHKFIFFYILAILIFLLLGFIMMIFKNLPQIPQVIISGILMIVFFAWFRFFFAKTIKEIKH